MQNISGLMEFSNKYKGISVVGQNANDNNKQMLRKIKGAAVCIRQG